MPKTKQEIQKWFKDKYNIDIELGKSENTVYIEPNRFEEKSKITHSPFEGRDELDIKSLKQLGDLAPMAAIEFFKFYYSEVSEEKELPSGEQRIKELQQNILKQREKKNG